MTQGGYHCSTLFAPPVFSFVSWREILPQLSNCIYFRFSPFVFRFSPNNMQRLSSNHCHLPKPAVMKKFSFVLMMSMLAALPVCFTACIKEDADNNCKRKQTYVYYEPVYKTKSEVRANIKSNAPRPIEKPGKIYILGKTIFLNETDKGIHVIDNTNPSDPKNIAFIDIPGNLDIAAMGNILYADMYTDLVALDISSPSNVKVKKIVDNLFPFRAYGSGFAPGGSTNQGDVVIADWVKKETSMVVDCNALVFATQFDARGGAFFSSAASSNVSASPVGTGGSMARFTIMNKRLYTVSINQLNVYSIENAAEPQLTKNVNLGWNIETIYPFKDRLFIGSQTGMMIYDVDKPDDPKLTGQFSHVRSCDPVIADDDYAYVTLRSGNACWGTENELDILKLSNTGNPVLEKKYAMINPHGLAKDNNILFV
jgi:hypothetical protein